MLCKSILNHSASYFHTRFNFLIFMRATWQLPFCGLNEWQVQEIFVRLLFPSAGACGLFQVRTSSSHETHGTGSLAAARLKRQCQCSAHSSTISCFTVCVLKCYKCKTLVYEAQLTSSIPVQKSLLSLCYFTTTTITYRIKLEARRRLPGHSWHVRL